MFATMPQIRRVTPYMCPNVESILGVAITANGCAEQIAPWHDPPKHKIQFVTVEEGVRLEVLDWGGSGRAIVLLAGRGSTAHVFDGFAEKLSDPRTPGFSISRRTRSPKCAGTQSCRR